MHPLRLLLKLLLTAFSTLPLLKSRPSAQLLFVGLPTFVNGRRNLSEA